MSEDIDPEDPRPPGTYHANAASIWYNVDNALGDTIAIGQIIDAVTFDDIHKGETSEICIT